MNVKLAFMLSSLSQHHMAWLLLPFTTNSQFHRFIHFSTAYIVQGHGEPGSYPGSLRHWTGQCSEWDASPQLGTHYGQWMPVHLSACLWAAGETERTLLHHGKNMQILHAQNPSKSQISNPKGTSQQCDPVSYSVTLKNHTKTNKQTNKYYIFIVSLAVSLTMYTAKYYSVFQCKLT